MTNGGDPDEKGNEVMFQILEDPNPPMATSTALTSVRTRARRIRRRRNAIASAPATIMLGATGAFLLQLGRHVPEEVEATSTSIPFTDVSSLPPFEDRGEVVRLDPVPLGYQLSRETFVQHPAQSTFERALQYTRIDGADPETSGISVFRIESTASAVLDSQAGGHWAETPGGHQVLLRDPGAGGVTANWYVGANVFIQINMQLDNGLDVLDLVDALTYEPAYPPCVVGEIVETYVACGEVAGYEVVSDLPD